MEKLMIPKPEVRLIPPGEIYSYEEDDYYPSSFKCDKRPVHITWKRHKNIDHYISIIYFDKEKNSLVKEFHRGRQTISFGKYHYHKAIIPAPKSKFLIYLHNEFSLNKYGILDSGYRLDSYSYSDYVLVD